MGQSDFRPGYIITNQMDTLYFYESIETGGNGFSLISPLLITNPVFDTSMV
jgi:hypothetical protein